MAKKSLRHGFTTGACAAAASLGAARMLKEQRLVEEVEIFLPAGFSAIFRLQGQHFEGSRAGCFVVKDAGDDPDVTNGVEVHAEIRFISPPQQSSPWSSGGKGEGKSPVLIEGGAGIGRVTKKGLAVPVGDPAINPVPRRMIEEAVCSVFPDLPKPGSIQVVLSIPDGLARAGKTLNERLGIIGGLSILGTTGVVRPVSHQAWTDTLDVALDVALAGGCGTVVLSTGRTSELVAQGLLLSGRARLPLLEGPPEEAFIMMGDHVGHALLACHRRGFRNVILAAQFAKLVKIGCGHPQTHAGNSRLDLDQLAAWVRSGGLDEKTAKKIECANTAREAYEMSQERAVLADIVALRALAQLRRRAPGAAVAILLVGYDGQPAGRFGEWPASLKRERKS